MPASMSPFLKTTLTSWLIAEPGFAGPPAKKFAPPPNAEQMMRQYGAVGTLFTIVQRIANSLSEVECLRTLDRLRLKEDLTVETVAALRESVFALLDEAAVVEMTHPVLGRASLPLPVPLRTLDAIHLATALVWRDRSEQDLVVATHDQQLAAAARTYGFAVLGV